MFFLTNDPYIDNNEITYNLNIRYLNENTRNECFICLEYISENKSSKKMSNIAEYCKTCDCDLFVHVECLNKWFELYKNCPICRKTITQNKNCLVNFIKSNKILSLFYRVFYKKWICFLQICYITIFIVLLYEKINNCYDYSKVNDKLSSYYIDDNFITVIKNKTSDN